MFFASLFLDGMWNIFALRLLMFAGIFFVGCAGIVCWYKLNVFRLLYDALGCVDCWITNGGGDHLPAVVGILNNLGVNDIYSPWIWNIGNMQSVVEPRYISYILPFKV